MSFSKPIFMDLDVVEPPRIRVKYDLDEKILPRMYKSRIIRSIREAKRQHRLNGALIVFSSFKTNFDDYTITRERAERILSAIKFVDDDDKYTVDVIYTSFEKKMSMKERKRLDEQIKLAQSKPSQAHKITRLLEESARSWRIFHHRRRSPITKNYLR